MNEEQRFYFDSMKKFSSLWLLLLIVVSIMYVITDINFIPIVIITWLGMIIISLFMILIFKDYKEVINEK